MTADLLTWPGCRKVNSTSKFILAACFFLLLYQLYPQLQQLRSNVHPQKGIEQRSVHTKNYVLQSIVRRAALHRVTPNLNTPLVNKVLHTSSSFQAYSNNGTFKNASNVVNPHPYSFVLNNADKCGSENVFLLIVVTSSPEYLDQRQAIRQTWGNESNVPGVVIKRVFAIGLPKNTSIQEDLQKENAIHRDIIQENFIDTYRNLTLKAVMVWKWAFLYCPQARFVMKTDDDAFVNVYRLVNHLEQLQPNASHRFVTGHVYVGSKPVRDPNSSYKKWYVTKQEYPRDTFPHYPCGCTYVISNDLTKDLFETSLVTEYLFIEDVYIGICLEKLGVAVLPSDKFLSMYTGTIPCSPQFDFIASHWVKTPQAMMTSWRALNTNCKESFFGLWDILRDLW
ncbi:hypothetical protein Bbelb_251170 [Branchiostoma belcheri]|nr:hypothetical protein Bbelb_251170 [Branchiostoma belcheri]